MLFRRSAATIRAHQEEAIRRRKSGRNSLRADRHRRRTGQAGREDFTSLVCQVVRRKSAEIADLCAGQGRQSCPVDVMLCVISYWVLSGAQQAADLQLRCTALPLSRARRSLRNPQKGEMVAETDPTQWPRRKARHLQSKAQ